MINWIILEKCYFSSHLTCLYQFPVHLLIEPELFMLHERKTAHRVTDHACCITTCLAAALYVFASHYFAVNRKTHFSWRGALSKVHSLPVHYAAWELPGNSPEVELTRNFCDMSQYSCACANSYKKLMCTSILPILLHSSACVCVALCPFYPYRPLAMASVFQCRLMKETLSGRSLFVICQMKRW